MTDDQTRLLEEHGFLVLQQWMHPLLLGRLRTRTEELFAEEGENAGSEFRTEENVRRLANLVAKGDVFEKIVCDPVILGYVNVVLGPKFKLSSLNARSANPNSWSRQPLHVDMGLVPDDRGYVVCNTVWMLDDFTEQNGALRVVPGSHKFGRRPEDELHDPQESHPDEVLVTGRAGTVVIMNAHLWHGGTENRTSSPRRALHGFYCRWDIPQQQYQKQIIPSELQQHFTPELRSILALDDPYNDEVSSRVTRTSGFLK